MAAHQVTPTLEQFGPRLVAFWQKAVSSEVRIPLERKQTGINLRHRLYRLRAVMKKEEHELYPLVARVTIQIHPNDKDPLKPWVLVATHVDKQFEALLADLPLDDAPDV